MKCRLKLNTNPISLVVLAADGHEHIALDGAGQDALLEVQINREKDETYKTPIVRELDEIKSGGLETVKFIDINGEGCSLQQSSLAEYEQRGSSAVWLGCDRPPNDHPLTKEPLSPRMHLDRERVVALIGHLQRWLDTGSFAPNGRSEPQRENEHGKH